MVLQCLLLCHDNEVKGLLRRALERLEIRVESPQELEAALEMQREQKFNGIIVDFDEPGAGEMLKRISLSKNENMVIMAILRTATGVREAFKQGANFAVYKPLTQEQANHALRAAKSLMHPTAPRDFRQRLHKPVQLRFGNLPEVEAVMLDLSRGGMAIRMLEPVEKHRSVNLRFKLPGSGASIEAKGEFAWADSKGRAGIRFVHLQKSSQIQLQDWLFNATAGKAGKG